MIRGAWPSRDVRINGRRLSPNKSRKLNNHSPDGFNWGYGGSGPAQLALALLLEFTDQQTALRLYQKFKFEVIGHLAQATDFELDEKVITDWLKSKEAGRE